MARNGKIARMSLDIRNELNRRLQDGEPGGTLLKWLNGLKPVQDILKQHFSGMPISEQNLSEWRQGGYKDWLRLEAARDFIDNMSEQSGELDEAAGGELISDRFGSILATEMAQLAMKFLEQEDDLEKRWNRLKEINREFSRMRRDDHRGVRTWIKRAQWEQQQERAEEAAEEKRRTQERVAAFFGTMRGTAPAKPGLPSEATKGAEPDKPPRRKAKVKRQKEKGPSGGAPGSKAEGRMPKAEVSGNAGGTPALRGESGQIKPNQTNSDLKRDEAGIAIKVEGSGFRVDKKDEPDLDDGAFSKKL
jgi:hypothetical protein